MKRTPLRRRSDKAIARDAELAESRKEVLARSFGRCEANTPACHPREHAGHHLHHIRLRSQGGGHGPENLLYVCADAHAYIHANPAEAAEQGWLARRYG